MRINSYPEDLDLIVRFEKCDLIFSKNPKFNTPILVLENSPRNFDFAISKIIDDKAVTTLYRLLISEDEASIVVKNVLVASSSDTGMILTLDGKEVNIEELEPLILQMVSFDSSFIRNMAAISFNCHTNRLGFKDIYCDLHNSYCSSAPGSYQRIKYYYYYSKPEMYAVAERLIKLGMISDIPKYNPVFSGKAIPDVSEIKALSKVSMELLKRIKGDNENPTKLFEELEKNPNIGVNGIKLIDEMLQLYSKIRLPYSCENRAFRLYWDTMSIFEGFDTITKQFNITTKNLVNRVIKASFYENLAPNDYIQLILDYIRISKLLGLSIPEKMPKDIVKDHDLISAQYKYMESEIIEKEFKKMVEKNKLLLNSLPENKHYTIITPEVPNDLIEEGLRMRHCVGTYIDKYAAGTSKIFFVRNKSNINNSCVTLELNKNNKLVQARSFANSDPSSEIIDFINEWINTLE